MRSPTHWWEECQVPGNWYIRILCWGQGRAREHRNTGVTEGGGGRTENAEWRSDSRRGEALEVIKTELQPVELILREPFCIRLVCPFSLTPGYSSIAETKSPGLLVRLCYSVFGNFKSDPLWALPPDTCSEKVWLGWGGEETWFPPSQRLKLPSRQHCSALHLKSVFHLSSWKMRMRSYRAQLRTFQRFSNAKKIKLPNSRAPCELVLAFF